MTVIDSHAHIAAPAGVFSYQARLIASGGYQERTAILSENTRKLFKLDVPAQVPAGTGA